MEQLFYQLRSISDLIKLQTIDMEKIKILSNEIRAIEKNETLSLSNAEILHTISIELYNLVRSEMQKCNTLNRMNFLIECRILSCEMLNTSTKFNSMKSLRNEVIKAYCRSGISILRINNVNIRGISCYERVLEILEENGGIESIITEKNEDMEICLESIYEMLVSYIDYISREEKNNKDKLINNIKLINTIISYLNDNKNEEIYNLIFGILKEYHKMNRYNDVIEIGEIFYSMISNNCDDNKNMKVLLLLSDCYIMNKDKKALNCLYLCEYEKYGIGIYLMIKYICFTKTKTDEIVKLMEMLLNHNSKEYSLCLDACHMILNNNIISKDNNELYWYNELKEHFIDHCVDINLEILEILLSKNPIPLDVMEILNEFKSNINSLSECQLSSIYNLLYNTCILYYENKQYNESINWCNELLHLLNNNNNSYIPSILRMLSDCYNETHNVNEAINKAKECIKIDNTIKSHFLLYHIYINNNIDRININEMKECLNNLMNAKDYDVKYLYLCCEEAIKNNNISISIESLERLLYLHNNIKIGPILRCLIELYNNNHINDDNKILQYFSNGLMKLDNIKIKKEEEEEYNEKIENEIKSIFGNMEEINWIVGILWNKGLLLKEKENYKMSHKYLKLCYEYSCYLPPSNILLSLKKSSLLLSSSLLFETINKNEEKKEEEEEEYKEVLREIEICKRLCLKLKKHFENNKNDNLIVFGRKENICTINENMLILNTIEMECNLYLHNNDNIEELFNEYIESSTIIINPEILEYISEIAKNTNSKPIIYKKCLSLCLQYLYQQNPIDIKCLSRILRKLLLQSENKEELYKWLEEINQICENIKDDDFDNSDYDFYTSISWNNGIKYLRLKEIEKSEKLLSLSLKFLVKSKGLQAYSNEMNEIYSRVLSEREDCCLQQLTEI